ncbi:flagellar hook-associated protein FlgK [Yoonia sp. 208BN28-4]|uniref:flagellar hook-associated protein FlgK n=1 Tax=Yoonia sp. 208BN28-4 TaxID=3126505 RepID=UPI0030B2C9D2
MSITSALNNAASGLTANARMAETVSSNLANALTDGYAKRNVALSAQQVTGGVRIDGIVRQTDRGLTGDRRLADAALGGGQRSANAMQALSRVFGDIGAPDSLPGRLAALEQSLLSASADPASETRLTAVINRLKDVTGTMKIQSDAIQSQRVQADASIARDVNDLNTALEQVEKLNGDILRLRGSGLDTSNAQDARQQAIDRVASLVPIRELDRANGQVALITTSGQTLIDGKAANFDFQATPVITADMTLASGALSGISMNGRPLDPADGVGRLAGGALAASFALRDTTLTAMQTDLDAIAADLITRFADPAVDPTLVPGAPGLITDRGAALAATPLEGLAGRLQINPNVDPSKGGDVSRLRDGVDAAAVGPVGRNTQINAWVDALRQITPIAGTSAAGLASRFEEGFSRARLDTEADTAFATARWETLRTAELSLGVDTDQELQQLLVIEQAYAANAKVIQTVDFMIQRLMEI